MRRRNTQERLNSEAVALLGWIFCRERGLVGEIGGFAASFAASRARRTVVLGPAQNIAESESLASRTAESRAILERALERFVSSARSFPDVRAAYVFGSLARDDVGVHSDLDVLVLTPAEFAEQGRGSSFWADMIAEAKLIYAGYSTRRRCNVAPHRTARRDLELARSIVE